MLASLKNATPWWAKVGLKVALARVPLDYDRWRRIGVFQHGFMLEPEYAGRIFESHLAHARGQLADGYTTLELGPGDSLATALIAYAHGGRRTWLVDAGAFASSDIAAYRAFYEALGDRVPPPAPSVAAMLESTGGRYLTAGLASLREIPSESVDFVFSQAVLEHVGLGEFDATLQELLRVMKPGAVSSHRVDLQDHLAHGLHSLRFPRHLWEAEWFARRSGFYTNRLRASEIDAAFRGAGYDVVSRRDDRWPAIPMRRSALHREFAHLSDGDLIVHGVDIVASRPR